MKKVPPQPPSMASHLLTLICPAQFREHMLGDLEEAYHRLHQTSGTAKARTWYWRECLHSLPFLAVNRLATANWRMFFLSGLAGSSGAIATSLGFFWCLKQIFNDLPPSDFAHWLLPFICAFLCATAGGFIATLVQGKQNRAVLCCVATVVLLPEIAFVSIAGRGFNMLAASVCLAFLGIVMGVQIHRAAKPSH